ncbi:exopolysaccharide biosynthesis polyprenyl glycosylphosphotransferase [Algimonas porphyrae]|uniref:(Fe-S)-cluster assembly protein n=1 Tax=Algimonas porphyrae TaxID=1128113 RepID=A0ABQ5V3Z8_9PROT|nr:exopolysaccharide biosynthesis polyprenyl glycosylphosphotransferase [Algimonas porphyrae]GLQ21777.1 (Fe-S)-cluster assembly protein [Algimonas porphyrae]
MANKLELADTSPVQTEAGPHAVARPRSEYERRVARPGDGSTVPVVDRRRKRQSIDDLTVPTHQRNLNALRFGMKCFDIAAITSVIALGIWQHYVGNNGQTILAPIVISALGSGIFIFMMFFAKAYRFRPTETLGEHLKTVLMAGLAALGVWLSTALILRPETFLPDALAMAGLGGLVLLLGLHTLYATYLRKLHASGRLAPTVVMLGATHSARRIIEENAKTRELNIVAIFDERLTRAPLEIHGVPVVGKIGDLLQWEGLPYVNRIVVTLPSAAAARKRDFVEKVRLLPNRIAYVADAFENLDHVKQRLSEIAEISVNDITGNPKSGSHTALKRAMDIAIGSVALALLAIPLAIIALLIRMDSPGPVLFRQPRHGFNNRVFNVLKFRTMRTDMCDVKAERQTEADDPRITKIGRFIRKTSIDELPQLINVIRGDMSLVGPRPHAVGMKTEGRSSIELVEEYAHRHKVKPGMTGWAQINGSRGPLHNGDDVQRRVQLDVEYIERSNVIWDLVIMAKTLPVMLGDREAIR